MLIDLSSPIKTILYFLVARSKPIWYDPMQQLLLKAHWRNSTADAKLVYLSAKKRPGCKWDWRRTGNLSDHWCSCQGKKYKQNSAQTTLFWDHSLFLSNSLPKAQRWFRAMSGLTAWWLGYTGPKLARINQMKKSSIYSVHSQFATLKLVLQWCFHHPSANKLY